MNIMNIRGKIVFSAITCLFASVLMVAAVHLGGVAGCGGDEEAAEEEEEEPAEEASGGVVDENGNTLTSVDTNDAVNVSLSGLTANTQYLIAVTNPSGASLSPSGGFRAMSDEDGNVPSSTIVQDLSATSETASLRAQGIIQNVKAQTGTYTITVTDANGVQVLQVTFTVADDDKVYCVDSAGTARASFTPGQDVHAKIEKGASGDLADGIHTCYARSDLAAQLADQDTLVGTTGTVTVASGTGHGSLGSSFALGPYDVVCDIDADGKYDRGSDLIARAARFRACFTVQGANSGNDIVGQICSDRYGNYKDIFDPNATDDAIRDVWAWISPNEQSLLQHQIGVDKYVVAHKDTWTNGDTLTDVTACSGQGGYERDSVQGFCVNEAPWMVWPRACLVAGCYDCIIDVNRNGVYDKGTDFLDNIDNEGDETTCGMVVSDAACAAITISSPSDGATVTDSTTTLSGSISDTTMTAGQAVITSGGSQNTIDLTVDGSGNFSSTIPLFNGENTIIVSFQETNGTGCAKTITVTANYSSSSNELIHITATWDADTDIDLHFVKPGGAYDNQGDGSSATDCNYSNCNAGESIDWGTAGDDTDDPELDIDDCVGGSCTNGRTENIVMTKVNEPGAYKIYTDAWSDQAGVPVNVTVRVYIKGAQVGNVSCPGQRRGTGTDTCFAGTIDWTGTGTSGNGAFTPHGMLADDF